jgi:peptide-methionine (S)-S-oxide reductase
MLTRALIAAALLASATGVGATRGDRSAIFAGGCFWGVEAVFEHVRGVGNATSGYVGGVESVQVTYDPSVVSHRELLEVFFRVAHDPTSRDRQGPDAGPAYRAIVFYEDAAERRAIEEYLAELERAAVFARPIVTEVRPRAAFDVAPGFHQDYAARHPKAPYVVINDVPKLERLRREFPHLYAGR